MAKATKLADPAGVAGFAIRQVANMNGGARSQLSVWTLGGLNAVLNRRVQSGQPIYIAQEIYVPAPAIVSGSTVS